MGSRVPASERRSAALDVSVRVFAEFGFHGASMGRISDLMGISQPYLFRLYPTKRALFIACIYHCTAQIREGALDAAARANGEVSLKELGDAYADLIADEAVLMFQLQAWALAPADEEIREICKEQMAETVQLVLTITGAPESEVNTFFARGAMLIVRSAIGMAMPPFPPYAD